MRRTLPLLYFLGCLYVSLAHICNQNVDVTNINVTSTGSRSVTVTWALPSADPANYSLHIRDAISHEPPDREAATGCDLSTTWPIIIPWNVTTYKEQATQGPYDIKVPYPFWEYEVAVVMSIETCSSTPQWIKVETLEDLPGAVPHLEVKSRKPVEDLITCGDESWESYNDVCVMWEEICPRERGDNITSYEYSLWNGVQNDSKNVSSRLWDKYQNNAAFMRHDRTRTTYHVLVTVDTGATYTLCVTAIGLKYKGHSNCTSFEVLKIKPNITDKEQHQASEMLTQKQKTTFTLSLTSYCFMTSDIYGKVVNNGFVISKETWTNNGYLSNLPTWYNRSMGYYQIRPHFLDNKGSCKHKKSLVVGNEVCDNPSLKPYCNGPLDAGTKYSVTAFV